MHDLSVNRRALFDYEILEKYIVGIELLGFEVKSAKAGRMQIAGSFVVIKDNEAWLLNAAIPPYQVKNTPENYDPARSRKLLLRKSEIAELIGKTAQKGLTLIPLRVYAKRHLVKLEIGLGRHRKKEDKRQVIKKREASREIEKIKKSWG